MSDVSIVQIGDHVTVVINGRLVFDSRAPAAPRCAPECCCWWARLRRWRRLGTALCSRYPHA